MATRAKTPEECAKNINILNKANKQGIDEMKNPNLVGAEEDSTQVFTEAGQLEEAEDGKKYLYLFRAKCHTTHGVNFYAKGEIFKRTKNEAPNGNFEYVGKEEVVEKEPVFDPLAEAYRQSRRS